MSEPEGRAFRPKDIAIIGMSGRFPGARDINEFWRNQLNGVEAIRRFDAEPGNRSNGDGSSEGTTLVGARAVLDQADQFDADFFGMHPREAALTDPQHRIFLECCWEAFEDAGYEPGEESEVGVFAGCAMPTYFLSTLGTLPGFLESFTRGYQVENYAEMLGNSLDFLATRVSYKLDLRGPSFTLQAGCSTSLLAVCQACDALRNRHCELALAGGISITFPQMRAARYQDGGMISADGHCRAFDAAANGTVFGCGAGVVLLKRLGEAMRDGDHVYGVIRGYAVNNDGSAKAGYTAPSVEGQARVIAAAHRDAEVGGNEIGYIEAHGTGTPLGDPIELTALNQVFRGAAAAKNSCAIGTAKTNVGHLDVAAGITGLIHAVQILRHAEFPPTLHFRSSNGHFGMEESPFYVNQQRKTWPRQRSPRRAGVSSFGIGGTNAHVILEEKPIQEAEPARKTAYLLTVSARSEGALQQASADLASFLGTHAETNLADAAYTLHCGRKAFAFRRAVSVKDASEVMQALTAPGNLRGNATAIASEEPRVVFLFPGQGSQERGMASDIYENEKGFREPFDRCAEILKDPLRADLREIVFNKSCAHDFDLDRTEFAQPAIFAVEYALAQLWESWGIRPSAMLGHSIGEYVAATLAGVMTLEDALALVAARGKLMQEVAPGAMLAVRASEASLTEMLSPSVSLAAVNSSRSCVVSGSIEAIEGFESQLQEQGVATRRLKTSHAFHSAMMDSVLERFTERARAVRTKPAAIPYVSCLTGNWITEDDLRNPNYWANHLRGTVRFASGLRLVTRDAQNLLLEVGPGKSLAALVREEVRGGSRTSRVVSSVPDISAGSDSYRGLLEALGWLWTAGADVDWRAFHGDERRLRVSLPTYPFERKRFWLDSPTTKNSALDGNHTEQGSIPVSTSPNTPSLPESSRPRTDERIERLRSDVMAILTNLSGAALSTAESSTTFLELGFDSLFLAQVSIALQKQFGVKVTFRQLLNDFSSAERLAAHLDGVLPRDVSKGEKPAAREDGPLQATPNREQALPGSDAPVDSQPTRSPLQTLMQEQLRAMNELFAKQLEAMEKSGEDGNPRTALRQKSADVAQPTPACAPSAASAPEASRRKQEAVEKAFTPHHPPATKHSGEWSNSQRAYLSELIERYTKRTARSKALTQQYRRVLADPRVVSGFRPEWKEMVYPIVTIRSEGSHLWDVDGNEYIDLLNGFGPIFFGHRPESIERAVAEQLHQGFEIGPQSQLAGEVAALFCELTGNERMTFCNTGSEAVMAALRVSRTVTGRSKVVVFAGAYHGMFDEVLITRASGGSSVGALPIAPGIPQENLSNMVVLEYGSASALDWIRQHASELAAVLVEPVQSRHPALQPVEFLKELRGLTAASGTALIFDEVVTGFRVHPGGCQALFGIRADLATYGKVLAGGLPIGVLAGRAEFMNALDGGPWQFGDDSYPEANVTFFAGTFVRHPLALAAAKATLGQLKSAGPKLQEDLARRTTRLAAALRATFEQQLIPAQIEDFTSLFYMQFPREFPYGSLLYYALREKGIYILEGFPSFLTTAHSGQDVARIEESFSQAAEEMHAAGFYSKGEAPSPRLVMGSERSTEPQTVEVALTEAQMEILLAAQMSDAASCAFNESFTIRLCGTLDRSAFETALGELFARHDALRASISTEAQMLRFAKQVELPLRFQNLSGLSRSDADAAIADAVRSDALLPFDLAKPPLVRMTLFQLSATEHALLFTAHHVVCDGWSSNVLLSELATLYSAQISGDASKLSPALQFSEYALRQAATRAKTEDREFWMAQFRDLAPVLELPTDRSRPVVKSFAGATARSDIERTLLERIKRASTSQGCTLFAALLTAFGALLHRLTSQDDIAIGIPFAGQSSLAESNLVGHCVNFLPIRMRWFEADTAADALQRVQRSLLDAQEHQDFTYGTLVRERNVPRQPGRLPLIEVQFNLEKIGGGLSFQGLQAEIETNPKAAVNFDLFLNAVETKNGLRLECDYNSDLFDERTIERWLSHYAVLLEGMASNQNQPISAQPLLTEAQRKQLISEWNATERDFPLDLRVYELFQTQAARTPEKIAVSGKGGALTYQQLEERSNQLARHLLKIGLQPNDLIGVALDRSINMFVTLLAVWKAGVAYVPLDPAYPQERIAFILDDASVPILITTSDLIERLPVCDARLVCLDRDSILIEREAASSPDPVANTQPLAYVIYTSGSTGRPKGVAVTQRNLVNLLLAMQLEPGITPEDRLLAVTTLSFDIAALELFLPIVSGAQVVLAARDDAADGRALRRLMQNENITMLQATPATWRLLLEAGWPEEHRLKMLCGGEALSRDLADALLPHGELWNMYGPTETTVWSAVSRVTRGTGSIPLGHPIANTQFYVLDSHQQLLPLGVAGELCIGGEGVAQGYFHRPDLTEKVFLPDPFHPNGQHRIYRTGDTVRCHADGTLEFLGRSDQQVKIRGFRVELQEVEAALNRHPGIRQAVAAGCNDEHGFKKLVAYVVPERPPEAPDPSELREWLRGHLPTYMIPSQYIFLDALPHTPNGKVDRKSLPHPEDAARLTDEFVSPRTPLEAQIASLCATVMQVDRIGVTTSLLDLGADSLHLFQIASRAAAAGLPVTAEQIMRLHTVEALAKEIGRTKESDSSFGALPPLAPLAPLAPAAREQFRVASAD